LAQLGDDGDIVRIEHPTGTFDARVRLDTEEEPRVITAGIVRTARKLMDGTVFPRSY
jgi:4-oxalomesaconate tautomerase